MKYSPKSGGEGRSERPRKPMGSKTSSWSPAGDAPRGPRAPREGGSERSFNRGGDRGRDDRPQRSGGGSTYRREGATGGWNSRGPRTDAAGPGGRPNLPRANPNIVPARKLKEGIGAANRALAELMEDFGQGIAGDYDISSLEATLSFDTDGRFLGFGAGGSATITLTLTPLDAENVFHGEDIAAKAGETDDLDELENAVDEDDVAEGDSDDGEDRDPEA